MIYNIKKKLLLKIVPFLANLVGFDMPPVLAACAIIEKDGKVLSIDLAYKKGLSLPGGGLNKNETLEQGLIREVKEETNLNVTSMKYLGSNFSDLGKIWELSACFKVEIKDFSNMKPSSEGELFWVTPQKIYDNPAYPDIKKHIKDYFKL